MGTPRTLLVSVVALVALVAAGCVSSSTPEPHVPYTAVGARLNGSTLRIRYLSPDGLLYSASELPANFAIRRHAHDDGFPVFVVTPVATARESTPGEPSGRRVPVLGPEDYVRVRDAAVGALVPREPGNAVVVEMEDGIASLYFEEDGRLESYFGEPPAGIAVVSRVALQDFLNSVPGVIEDVLEEHGIASRDALFNTGETDSNPWPFVYVDLDAAAAAFVLRQPTGAPVTSELPATQSLTRSVTHAVSSHTIGLVQRPVTSLTRLFCILTDVARDSVDPDWVYGIDDGPIPPISDGPAMDLDAWESELDAMTGRASVMCTMTPLVDGEAFFTRFEQAICAAENDIALRIYIFDNDDYAVRVADLLRARADDGIDVRVLVDGLGTLGAGAAAPAGLPGDHEPPVSIQDYLEDDSSLDVRTILNPFGSSDHTKAVIIDDEIAFVGGMNIGREYRYEWHDMMVEVRGQIVARLADDFDAAWAGAGFFGDLGELIERMGADREPGPPIGYPLRALYTRPTSSEIRRAQLAAAKRSRRYAYVHYAYFSDDALLRELVRARRRGVDVRVVIPLASDRGLLARSSIMTANELFRNGVRVYIYPGMSHVKAAVFDGWACLGSANANELSLRYNLETNLATSAPEAVQPLLKALFEPDFRDTHEMRAEFPTRWHDHLWELIGDYAF